MGVTALAELFLIRIWRFCDCEARHNDVSLGRYIVARI